MPQPFNPATIPDPVPTRADAVRVGDRVDLEGLLDDVAAEFEFATCASRELETADCVRLDFEGFDSVGFDPGKLLPVVPREAFPDADAWREEEAAQAAEAGEA